MATHDKNGREYAKLDDLKAGDVVELDGGFPCHAAGTVQLFNFDRVGKVLFFWCNGPDGESKSPEKHFIDGQDDGDGHCVGIYKTNPDSVNIPPDRAVG